MSPAELLAQLARRGVVIWADGERLRYRAPEAEVDATLRAQMQAQRGGLMQLLQHDPGAMQLTYPLSDGQRALWFLYRLDPASTAYNTMLAARVRAEVYSGALRQALADLARRHLVLRSTYSAGEAGATQHVHEHAQVTLIEADGSEWSDAQTQRWLLAQARQPFDLQRGPVWRAALVRTSERESTLLLVVHHIAVDVLSYMVLAEELRVLYAAAREGARAVLAAVEVDYRDYVLWQTQWLRGQQAELQWSYWRKQLAGELPILDLPTDRPRPPVQTYGGASHRFGLEAALVRGLQSLAGRERATLDDALLAGFALLLHRYSGQAQIVIGSPATGRTEARFAQVVGFFANPVVLRLDVASEESFATLLERVRRTSLDARAHQDYPFSQLVQRLQPQRDPSRSPLFQVAFTVDKAHWTERLAQSGGPAQARDGLQLVPLPMPEQEGQFDLALQIIEQGGNVSGYLKYNTDLFDAATVEGFGVDYVRLLEAAVGRPDVPVWTLELLSGVQREALLGQGRGQRRELGAGGLVHALFEVQARAAPQRTALVYAGQSLSYGELDARANQVAHALRALGVRREMRVGVCVERSLEMVVGLLGVLKAGGAYVPLDPAHPRERLALMLQDAGVGVVLTQRSLVERLPQAGVQVKCLDESWEEMVRAARTDPELEQGPQDLAYVMYTSGSTGRPKGVQVEHAAVVNLLESMAREPGMGSDDVLLAVTNLSFDIAGLELFLPLAVGGQVVVATSEACSDGAKLARLLSQSGATLMQATPVTWRLLLGSGWKGQAGLKLLCGGEALSRELAEALLATGAQVWNLYGPTETTIWSTLQRVVSAQGAVPIGRALANTRLYVLDAQRQLVPAGVWGELYIGGCGVARGYLEQAQLSAERFAEDLFEPGQRMYRTGDWVRWRRDGALEYRGRMDEQVKLRGYRIELGEIESLLAGHPGVREAVVVVRSDGTGEGRLVAYVVLGGEESVLGELGPYLRGKLPAYMVPGVFVPIERLPVTANGKLDRRGLPDPVGVRAQPAAAYEAPRTPLEQLLAHTYAQVLGLERVGLHDNFFEIGGASLASLEITGRLHEAGVPIPAEWIFEHQSIAQLAAAAQSAAEQIGLEPSAPEHQRIGA